MSATLSIELDSFKKINKIADTWTSQDYHSLLTLMELDDGLDELTNTELQEMCLMSLGELKAQDAAKIVLTHLFTEDLSAGKIDQLSHEMVDDRLWEEYSDCLLHKQFFNAYGLLRSAFNGIFAQPTGVDFSITVRAKNATDLEPIDHALAANLVRLLAAGLGDDNLLHRLYEEQLQGEDFPQAAGILWQIDPVSSTETERQFHLISSAFWFEPLGELASFEATPPWHQ